MSASNIFDILGGKDTAQSLPEGSGVFSNRGFVGAFTAATVHSFYSGEDITLYESPYVEGEDFVRRGEIGKFWYYFFDRDAAEKAMEIVSADYRPNRVWRFEMPVADILNPRGNMDNWGYSVSTEVKVYNMGYAPKRHEFHLMALPALIDALARLTGSTKERIWHADELLDEIADEDFTESLQFRLIGDPEATNDDLEAFAELLEAAGGDLDVAHSFALGTAETIPDTIKAMAGNVKIHYKVSTFWKRRAALWAALGEPNAEKYIPISYALTDRGKEQETSSAILSEFLRFTVEKWNTPLFGRLHLCKDPRNDAVNSKNNKRLTLALISELFASRDAAIEAVKDDGDEETTTTTTTPTAASTSNGGLPAMPEEWGDSKDEWLTTLGTFKEQYGENVPPTPILKNLVGQLFCTEDDIKAWWQYA